MSRVYTQALLEGDGPGGVTVPDGYTWVIRDISGTIQTPTPGAPTGLFFSAGGNQIFYATALQLDLRLFHWEGRVAVPEASTIAVASSGPGTFTYVITGYTLSLP